MRFAVGTLLVLLVASPARAQEACKMEMLKDPKLTLSDMFSKAETHAKAWKADVVPARIGNTSLGPLDAQGRSEAWNLIFYSASATATVTINTFRGMYNCFAAPGAGGRIPDLKPTFVRDGATLYALAQQHGGSLIGQGYAVSIQTSAAPTTRHATWYLGYSKPDGTSADLTVIVDANTGALEKVIKD